MLWTSIATGKRPYKHGIHGFSEPDPDSGDGAADHESITQNQSDLEHPASAGEEVACDRLVAE